MLFNSPVFVGFFALFFLLYTFVGATARRRVWLLLLASLVFYAGWDPRYLPLLVGTTVFDYWVGRRIALTAEARARKRLLVSSMAVNLGCLAYFKYADFLMENLFGVLRAAHLAQSTPSLNVVLPVGISFYTFQSMSYVIDVYRGELRATDHPVKFLAAVTFFPHLVAGPIIRASTLLPQFEAAEGAPVADHRKGWVLIAAGLCKKTFADLLAPIADRAFGQSGPQSALDAWTGALAFTGQIYGDFSGYTDMAIGIALLLGFQLPENFNLPYLSTSPVEFWKRWHISLSSWLRDYLYIPLGGNRHHRSRNLFITMLLGGLWHGASWTFVAWGAYHGALLSLTHLATQRFGPARWLPRGVKVALTFYAVVVGWVLFRAPSFSAAAGLLRDMHGSTVPNPTTYPAVATLVLVAAAIPATHAVSYAAKAPTLARRPTLTWATAAALLAVGTALGSSGHNFIYFQF